MPRSTARFLSLALAALLAGALSHAPTAAQDRKKRVELWDIPIGATAGALPDEAFADFACGTNGGPPSVRLSRFADFMKCRPEPNGLREVYVRYDDEVEYWARAHGQKALADHFGGTRVSVHPAVVSVLFDASGVVRQLRAVTDDRVSLHDRAGAHAMATEVRTVFGHEGWTCVDLSPDVGEEAIGPDFVKRGCEKLAPEGRVTTLAHFFRKAGQNETDPHTGAVLRGQFKSWAKVELTDPKFDAGSAAPSAPTSAPVARPPVAAQGTTPLEAFKAAATKDCPGCDLAGADLRFRDLAGANLAGAKLAGANLHGARLARADCGGCDLRGARLKRAEAAGANFSRADLSDAILHAAVLREADFSGADLSRANLNRVQAVRARLAGATLTEAMAYAADLAGADVSGARLPRVMAGQARLRQANLAGAAAQEADLHETDLTGATLDGATLDGVFLEKSNLRGARFVGAAMREAKMPWADLREADLSDANLVEANFYKADLRTADLSRADLSGAVLRRAFIGEAKMEGAKLSRAEMPDGDIHE